MSYAQFEIAFWHPFGPHGRETPEAIIERKRAEIETSGWTLWSFQYRPMLNDWYRELLSAKPNAVFAFCSEGRGAVDPAGDGTPNEPIDCLSYRFVGEQQSWSRMPQGIRVPHPFSPTKKLASAFIVQRVVYPVERFQKPAIEWFSPKARGAKVCFLPVVNI